MQPCLFEESFAESWSTPAAGLVATQHLLRQEAAAQDCVAGGGQAGPGLGLASLAHPCLPGPISINISVETKDPGFLQ